MALTHAKADQLAVEWLKAHRPTYDVVAAQWLLAPIRTALRLGIDAGLIDELVRGAELAYEADRYVRDLRAGRIQP